MNSREQAEHWRVQVTTTYPADGAPEAIAAISAAFDGAEYPAESMEQYAADLGLTPPDDRDGWCLVYAWGPNGEDGGPQWYHPADEPDIQVD